MPSRPQIYWTAANIRRAPRAVLSWFAPDGADEDDDRIDLDMVSEGDIVVIADEHTTAAVRYKCAWCRTKYRRNGLPDNRCRPRMHEHARAHNALTYERSHCPHVSGYVFVVPSAVGASA